MVLRILPIILIVIIIVGLMFWNKKAQGKDPKLIVLPLPGNRKAVTMPPFGVYIEPDVKNNDSVIKHEYCHWRQYQDKGLINFYKDYFKMKANFNYEENPMEQECFMAEVN